MTETWSVKEAAKVIGCGRIQAYRLVRENRIPHIRIGKRPLIRVPKQALSEWLNEQARKEFLA